MDARSSQPALSGRSVRRSLLFRHRGDGRQGRRVQLGPVVRASDSSSSGRGRVLVDPRERARRVKVSERPGGWQNELLVAYLLPTGHVAAYSVPLVGGPFLWGGKVYR